MPNTNKWYIIRAKAAALAVAGAVASAEIFIYGDIGESWYGDTVAAADFVREIAALDVTHITIRINSYGGSVSDGIAIHNAIKRHKAHVTTSIEGVAASIASLIAIAGDTVEMADNATMMLHAPWMYADGNSADLRSYADMLDTWAAAMATSYAAKTGQDQATMMALLTDGKDHWYTADQAIAEKFADAKVNAVPMAASLDRSALAARYKTLPTQTALPTAAAAATTTEEPIVPNPLTAADIQAAADKKVKDEQAVAAAVLAADTQRRTSIASAFEKFRATDGVAALEKTCADDHSCTLDQANSKLLAHLGKGSTPVAGSVIVTLEDERDKFRAGMTSSVMARAGLQKDDKANNYRGYSLSEVARLCLVKAGLNPDGMDKMRMVAAAFTHSGSDFPLLLANIAEKSMMKGYEEAEETFQIWTSVGTLSDFKVGKRVDITSMPSLEIVAEGAEYSYATVGERGEQVQLATYGKMFSITRQAIINDDLDAFSKIPKLFGRAAIRTVGDLVYAILTSNPNMADGVALFHADHANLIGSGTAISTASVDAIATLMALQKEGKAVLNIEPKYLLVPRTIKGTANVVRNSEYEVGASTRNNTTPNSVRETFEVVADARLDAVSTTAWYAAADQNRTDTIEVQYLDGNKTPVLEEQTGWNVDGITYKVRIDAAAKALGYRGLAKNPGA